MTVLIAAATRTPFTRIEGALAGWHPVDLAAEMMNAALDRAGLTASDLDDIWVGCAEPVGAQGANMARAAALAAGWPEEIGGQVVDRGATSGAAALHAGYAAIASGTATTVMVVGVCGATTVQPGAAALGRIYGRPWGDRPAARVEDRGGLLPTPVLADRSAAAAGIDRASQEAWTSGSLERRRLFSSAGITVVAAKPGARVAIQRATPVRLDDVRDRPEDLEEMPPSFDAEGAITGYTFAPPADGVACLILTNSDAVGPRLVATARSAGEILDPVGGCERALDAVLLRAGLDRTALIRVDITEPTAAAALLAIERLGIDPSIVNPDGGTLAVGDAGAAEELRLAVDAVAEPAIGLIAILSFGPDGAAASLIDCP